MDWLPFCECCYWVLKRRQSGRKSKKSTYWVLKRRQLRSKSKKSTYWVLKRRQSSCKSNKSTYWVLKRRQSSCKSNKSTYWVLKRRQSRRKSKKSIYSRESRPAHSQQTAELPLKVEQASHSGGLLSLNLIRISIEMTSAAVLWALTAAMRRRMNTTRPGSTRGVHPSRSIPSLHY